MRSPGTRYGRRMRRRAAWMKGGRVRYIGRRTRGIAEEIRQMRREVSLEDMRRERRNMEFLRFARLVWENQERMAILHGRGPQGYETRGLSDFVDDFKIPVANGKKERGHGDQD